MSNSKKTNYPQRQYNHPSANANTKNRTSCNRSMNVYSSSANAVAQVGGDFARGKSASQMSAYQVINNHPNPNVRNRDALKLNKENNDAWGKVILGTAAIASVAYVAVKVLGGSSSSED